MNQSLTYLFRRALVLSLLLGAGLSLLPAQPTHRLSWPEVQDSILVLMEKAGIPGLMVAVVSSDSVWVESGLGVTDLNSRQPVTDSTRFRMGSVTKSLTALCIMKLVQEGKFSLDAPLSTLLPDLRISNPWATTDPIRLVHLLEHTAGLDDLHPAAYYNRTGTEKTSRELVAAAQNSLSARWRPGSRMAYSNADYLILGYLMEEITGQRPEAYAQTVLFGPLEMRDARLRDLPQEDPQLATGHIPGQDSVKPIPFRPTLAGMAGSLQASARDMAALLQAYLRVGRASDSSDWLKPDVLHRMEQSTSTYAAQAGLTRGYGLGLNPVFSGHPGAWRGHSGGIDGFQAFFAYSRSLDRGFALAINANLPFGSIQRLLADWLTQDTVATPPPPYPLQRDKLATSLGFFTFASPRNQLLSFQEIFTSPRSLRLQGDTLVSEGIFSPPVYWVAVNDSGHFRRTDQLEASLALLWHPHDSKPAFAVNGQLYEHARKGRHILFLTLFALSVLIIMLFVLVGTIWLLLGALKRVDRQSVYPVWPALVGAIGLAGLQHFLNAALQDFFRAGLMHGDTIGLYVSGLMLGLGSIGAFLMALRYLLAKGLTDPWAIFLVLHSMMLLFLAAMAYQYDLIGLQLWNY
ncbi:MAG: hypothetical protein D6722_21335 [Bacteroidetes bacterium]|nr:MAG: hypothetical protein D6722_21335 [Bacteroidota bacterium]